MENKTSPDAPPKGLWITVSSGRGSLHPHFTLGGWGWKGACFLGFRYLTSQQWGDTFIWGCNKWLFSDQSDINFSFLLLILHTALYLLHQEAISPICLGR